MGAELEGHGRELQAVAQHLVAAADAIARDMHGLARAAGEGWEGSPAELASLARHAAADAEEITGLADWLGTCAARLAAMADTLLSLAAPAPAVAPGPVPAGSAAGCPALPQEVAPCGNRG